MITQVAIRDSNNTVWTLPRPNRHGDLLKKMIEKGVKDLYKVEMGFIDEHNNFYNRLDAMRHVIDCNQPTYVYNPIDPSKRFLNVTPNPDGPLFSEDLW